MIAPATPRQCLEWVVWEWDTNNCKIKIANCKFVGTRLSASLLDLFKNMCYIIYITNNKEPLKSVSSVNTKSVVKKYPKNILVKKKIFEC